MEPAIMCKQAWIGTISQSCPDSNGRAETSFRFGRVGVPDSLKYHAVLGEVVVDSIRKGDSLPAFARVCVHGDCTMESFSVKVMHAHPEDVLGALRHHDPAEAVIDSGPIMLLSAESIPCL